MVEGIDMAAWERVVKRARNAKLLEPGLAELSGMPHDKADKILAVEAKRIDQERVKFLENKMNRPGAVLRQKGKKKNWGEALIEKAIEKIK